MRYYDLVLNMLSMLKKRKYELVITNVKGLFMLFVTQRRERLSRETFDEEVLIKSRQETPAFMRGEECRVLFRRMGGGVCPLLSGFPVLPKNRCVYVKNRLEQRHSSDSRETVCDAWIPASARPFSMHGSA